MPPKKHKQSVHDRSPKRPKSELLKLYLVSYDAPGWDVYTDLVVAGGSEEEARDIHPFGDWASNDHGLAGDVWIKWEKRAKLEVTQIGTALPEQKRGVIHRTFKPG